MRSAIAALLCLLAASAQGQQPVTPTGPMATQSLGTVTVDAQGRIHLALKACAGDPLPFGVASAADLAGYGVIVQDAKGVAILAGAIPGKHFDHDGSWNHEGHNDGHGERRRVRHAVGRARIGD